jgi:hypothetical protein
MVGAAGIEIVAIYWEAIRELYKLASFASVMQQSLEANARQLAE